MAALARVHVNTVKNWTRKGWLVSQRLYVGQLAINIYDAKSQARAIRLGETALTHGSLLARHRQLRTNPDGSRRRQRVLPDQLSQAEAQANQ
jgi:hypothetical protein